MAGVDSILSEAYEKAKIEVFGDSFAEQDHKWIGSVTFLEYVFGTAKHYVGAAGAACKAAVGLKAPAKTEEEDVASVTAKAAVEQAETSEENKFSPMDMLKGIKSSVDALATDMHDLSKHLKDTRAIATYVWAPMLAVLHVPGFLSLALSWLRCLACANLSSSLVFVVQEHFSTTGGKRSPSDWWRFRRKDRAETSGVSCGSNGRHSEPRRR